MTSKMINKKELQPWGKFMGDATLTSVTIADDVKEIPGNSFCECPNLAEVFISDGVEIVHDNAFKKCTSLSNVVMPDSVTEILDYAFYGCKKLSKINIPSGLHKVGKAIFRNTAMADKAGWIIIDGVLYDYVGKETIVNIPDGVTKIASNAFYDMKKIQSIIIPVGVTEIGEEAFRNCKGLTSVIFPDTLEKIDAGAFKSCKDIDFVELPHGVETFEGSILDTLWTLFTRNGLKSLIASAMTEQYPELVKSSKTLQKRMK